MITPIKVPDAPIIYAKPKLIIKTTKNGVPVPVNGQPNQPQPVKKEPVSQPAEQTLLDKTDLLDGQDSQKLSLPPSIHADPVPVTTTATTVPSPPPQAVTATTTTTTTVTTSGNNIPVATLVTTA